MIFYKLNNILFIKKYTYWITSKKAEKKKIGLIISFIFFKYISFKWGNVGNLLQDDKANYTYNDFNQTTKVETFDGNIQINRYDTESLRYEMEENGQIVQFIFNTGQVLLEINF